MASLMRDLASDTFVFFRRPSAEAPHEAKEYHTFGMESQKLCYYSDDGKYLQVCSSNRLVPAVKMRFQSFRNENINFCRASIVSGARQLGYDDQSLSNILRLARKTNASEYLG